MTLVVLDDPPPGLDFGVDTFSWTTGPDFKGLSLIPKGLHFFCHSTGLGARQGFFVRVDDKEEVIVRHWDASTEEISSASAMNEQQLLSLSDAIKRGDFNSNLGPYPFDQHRSWRNLTNLVNNDVLETAGCDLGVIILPGDAADVAPLLNQGVGKTVIPYLPDTGRVAKWSDVKGVEASVRESIISSGSMDETRKWVQLSRLHMDRSLIVQKLVETVHKGRLLSLLGELQLSFILFLILYSHPALQHWIACVDLICNSEQILKRDLQFTQYFLRLLYEQLNFVPLDFFSDELSKDNFLGPAMSALFSALSPAAGDLGDASLRASERDFLADEVVMEHRNRLLSFLRKKFGLFEESSITVKNMSLYQRKTRHNVELEASEKEELLRNVDGAHGSKEAEEDLPVIVSIDMDNGRGRANSFFDAPGSGSGQQGLQSPLALAERDLESSKAMMGTWGMELDRSFASASIAHETKIVMEIEEQVASRLTPTGNVTPSESDAYSDADADIRSGLTDKEPTEEMMTNMEIEMQKYCWRYPALHEEMMAALEKGVQEDFVMVCARVLEEGHASAHPPSLVVNEAMLFLEEELGVKESSNV